MCIIMLIEGPLAAKHRELMFEKREKNNKVHNSYTGLTSFAA